jgi:hypothetical protein
MTIFLRRSPCSIVCLRRCLPEALWTQPSRTPDARSCKVSAREMAGAFPPRSCEATIHEIAHRVKPDGGLRDAVEVNGVPEKMRMALCRASIRLPFPTFPGKLCAPRHGGRAGHGVARGELATADARRATKSTMNLDSDSGHRPRVRARRRARCVAGRGRADYHRTPCGGGAPGGVGAGQAHAGGGCEPRARACGRGASAPAACNAAMTGNWSQFGRDSETGGPIQMDVSS